MSDVVEMVAMALWDAHHCDTSNRRDVSMPEYRDMARAAIAALASTEPDAGPEPHESFTEQDALPITRWLRHGTPWPNSAPAIAHRVTQWDNLLAAHAALRARAEAAEAEVERLRAVIQPLLRYPDNGYHYCRSCSAGTRNGWQHEEHCSHRAQELAVDAARAALSPETKAKLDGGDGG